MREVNQHIGAMIRANRKNRSLTQEQLAALMGITKAAVSRMESGATALSTTTLVKVANALNCVIDIRMTPAENIR